MVPVFMIVVLTIRNIKTNNSVVAAKAIPTASASSFPSVISITEGLRLTQNHSGGWP